MSSNLVSSAAWAIHGHIRPRASQRRDDGLERPQSRVEENHRSSSEGAAAGLTEVLAPAPAAAPEKGDHLEDKKASVGHDTSDYASKSTAAHDEELAEVKLEAPVARSPSSSESSSSQHDQQASLERGEEHEKEASTAPVKGTARRRNIFHPEIVTVSWLIFFSLLGTLSRLGIEAITTYPYEPVISPVLWANLGGSFFFGFLLQDRRLFFHSATDAAASPDKDEDEYTQQVHKRKKAVPFYIGLATGFCGSFTSFSSYILDAFLALSNALAPDNPAVPYRTIPAADIMPRDGGYSFEAVIAILIVHPAVSIAALKTGAHLAAGLDSVTPKLSPRLFQHYVDLVMVPVAWGCWIGAVMLTIWPVHTDWRFRVTTALVFSPPGCLLRFYVSKYLNSRVPSFPLGTFAVNIFGTCVLGMCYDLQHAHSVIGRVTSSTANSCAVLEGIIQGFCGCLTTVSTWVGELNGLRRRHAWTYGLVTVGVALGFQVVIMGSMAWTVGFDQRCA